MQSETETCVRHLPVGRLHSRSNIKFLAYVVIFMARKRERGWERERDRERDNEGMGMEMEMRMEKQRKLTGVK